MWQAYVELTSRCSKFKMPIDEELKRNVETALSHSRRTVAEYFMLDGVILAQEPSTNREGIDTINSQLEAMESPELNLTVDDLFAPLWRCAQAKIRGQKIS